VIPPAQAGAAPVVVAEVHAPPPPRPELQKGDAQWVKVFKTELPRGVHLDELTTDNPAVVPLDPSQTEIEWKLLQHNPHSPNSGTLKSQGALGGGSHAVIRRYEFYKYTGAYDPHDHGVLCGGDGSCSVPLDGELGDYIGAQMAAANVGDAVPVSATATASLTLTPTRTPIPCGGDCRGDETVTVDDLLTLVNVALGNANVGVCTAGDMNHDNEITIDEILTAVANALNGCPGR
jgi:hypothetical protein